MPRIVFDIDVQNVTEIGHILSQCTMNDSKRKNENINRFEQVLRKLFNPNASYSASALAAIYTPSSHIITFAGAPANTNTLTINGVTITSVTTVSNPAIQFALGADRFQAARNLCDCLNQSSNASIQGRLIARVLQSNPAQVLIEGTGALAVTAAVGTMPNATVGSSVAASTITQRAFGYST